MFKQTIRNETYYELYFSAHIMSLMLLAKHSNNGKYRFICGSKADGRYFVDIFEKIDQVGDLYCARTIFRNEIPQQLLLLADKAVMHEQTILKDRTGNVT